jgi:short-subunit dehydrogenase
MLAVHVAGAFNVTQPIYREMKRNRYGRILFTSSASGLLGNTTQTGYGAAKSAVIGLMNCIALEGEPHGILCNALLPSSATRMAESMLPEIMARIGAASVKFHSSLTPENVSPLAAYLVSRDCVSTHGIYSAVGNRFSRAFIGMTRGWMAPQGQIPSVEEISAHFGEISDPTNYEILNNLTEEYESIARRL